MFNDRDEFHMQEHTHRYICACFEEMRKLLSTQNVDNVGRTSDVLLSLVEEAQVYANRMETALAYTEDLNKLHKMRKDLTNEVRYLKRNKPDDNCCKQSDEDK